jgi:hypothetical protein
MKVLRAVAGGKKEAASEGKPLEEGPLLEIVSIAP